MPASGQGVTLRVLACPIKPNETDCGRLHLHSACLFFLAFCASFSLAFSGDYSLFIFI